MDTPAILTEVKRWVRVRNGLRAGLSGVVVVLGAAVGVRVAGGALPGAVWYAVPAVAAVGWGWPLGGDRFLLWAGRRLGVGERLAALAVVARRGVSALVGLLQAEIVTARPRGWRLIAGAVEYGLSALAVVLALAVRFAVPLGPGAGSPQPPEVAVPTSVPPPDGATDAVSPAPAEPPGLYPAQAPVAEYSPYQDLLALVLGAEGAVPGGLAGEEVAAWLAAEEGLLRKLAEELAAAAPGGFSASERADLARLARRVARPDLRARLEELLHQEGERPARQAVEAVRAVLDATERARETGTRPEGAPGEAPAGIRAAEGTGVGSTRGEGAGEGLLDPADLDADGRDELAKGEEGSGPPGTMAGDPLDPMADGDWTRTGGGEVPYVVGGREGPRRAYIVPGTPGEPPSGGEIGPVVLSPQEVEVVLRARGVPAELRDLVRRYFELVGGNP